MPDIKALTAKQEAFAEEYVRNGGNATQAAIEAGYSAHTASVQGSRLIRQDNVKEAIHSRSIALAERSVPMALQTLVDIIGDGAVAPRDRIVAAREILDRGGLPKPTKDPLLQVNVNTVDPVALIKKIEDERQERLAPAIEHESDGATEDAALPSSN